MNQSARLKMLFDDADEGLLKTNVGLAAQQNVPKPAAQVISNTTDGPLETPAGITQPIASESDSEEYEDEYLAALAASARDARRKAKLNAANNPKSNKKEPQVKPVPAVKPAPVHEPPAAQPAFEGRHYFCPAVAISRFPWKFLKGDVAERVGKSFFDGGKFWGRSWKLYVSCCR